MASLLTVLTLGILPALWLSGYALLGCFSRGTRLPLARGVVFCVAPAVSLPLWSVAMTLSAMFGLFHAPLWGAIGWIACIPLVPLIWRRRLGRRPRLAQEVTFGFVLAAAFAMYAAFPHDSFFVGRDQATYANQALHIARTGELKLRMPARLQDEALRESVSGGYTATGLYVDSGQLTVQFSPVLPIWLATAFSAFGIIGLQGFNALVAVLSAGVFFGIAGRLMPRWAAVVATLTFALEPMQIWIARITLSEPLAQYLVLAGLLLPLVARRRLEWLWVLAGATLGASVFVRIDGFVLAPLVIAGAWLFSALAPPEMARSERAARLGVLGVLGALGLGVPFYLLTSAPYMLAQAKNLVPIAAATAALAIPWALRVKIRQLAPLMRARGLWVGLAIAFVSIALYAYFIRPRWGPFHYQKALGQDSLPKRDFRENSLVNLGAYLTPALVFTALGGFWSVLRRTLSVRPRAATLLLLVVWGGYTLLYLYNPAISADHPWGMRRFVPVIIPGFILFGFVAIQRLCQLRLLRRFRLPITALLGVAVVGMVNYRSRASLLLKEYDGAYEFVTSVADAIPKGALLLCDVSPRLFGHLALARQLETIKASFKDPARFAAAQAVVTQTVREGEAYYVLVDSAGKMAGHKPIRTFKASFEWLAETTNPPATRQRDGSFSYFLFERRGPLDEPWRYLADLGMGPVDGVREEGFWPVERSAAERSRWTEGTASLDIRLKEGWTPSILNIEIIGMAPSGTWFTVRANDVEIYNAELERAPVNLSLTLPKNLRKRLRLELVSDTFRPSEVSASSDERELGVRLRSLSLR